MEGEDAASNFAWERESLYRNGKGQDFFLWEWDGTGVKIRSRVMLYSCPQVCVISESKSSPSVGGPVESALQVIVTQPSPCPTPALSPQIPANTTSQAQVSVRWSDMFQL